MKKGIAILVVLAGLAGGLLYAFRSRIPAFADTEPADHLLLSGTVEAHEVDLGFEVSGRVEELLHEEGDRVKKGAPVARLEQTSFRQAVRKQRARLKEARARLDELTSGFRPEKIDQAKAKVRQLKAEHAYWQDELERQRSMQDRGVTSDTRFGSVQRRVNTTEAQLAEAKSRLQELQNGYRSETIRQARANVQALEAALALAEDERTDATLKTPLDGWVLTDNVSAGEFVTRGTPVMTVADMQNVWVRAYVNETDLGRVKRGQAVRVRTDSFPEKTYEGTVTFISDRAEFTPRPVETHAQRVKQVYRIKISVHNPDRELRSGMPVDARLPFTE